MKICELLKRARRNIHSDNINRDTDVGPLPSHIYILYIHDCKTIRKIGEENM